MRVGLQFVVLAGLAAATSACISMPSQETVVGDYLAGRLAAKENDVDAAAIAFADAQSRAPGAGMILRDAFFFQLASGRIEEAVPFARKLAASGAAGDDGLAHIVLAAHAMKYKRYGAARKHLSDGIDATYLVSTSIIVDAWALSGLEGPAAGYKRLDDTTDEIYRGFNPLHMALLAEQAGQEDDARAAHQISKLTLANGFVGLTAHGAFLERAGDIDGAREHYEQMLQNPGAARNAARAGIARLDAGNVSNEFASTTPSQGAAIAFYSLANAMLQQSLSQISAAEEAGFNVRSPNYNMPLGLTQIAIYLDPTFDQALQFAGAILNHYEENDDAITTLSRIKPGSANYDIAQIEVARALADEERTEDAIRVLRSLSNREGNRAEARLALANLFSTNDRHDDAIDVLTAHIEDLPADPEEDAWRFFLARGASLLELGDWENAERDLKRAVEIAPEQPAALNYLGYSWAERGLNLEEAFDLIEKAVALQPNSGAIIDSLGWARYQLGDYEVAVGHLEQAASLEPGDPVITDHLGDVYWRLGRFIEARYQWRHVLELNPDDDLRELVERKILDGLPADEGAASR